MSAAIQREGTVVAFQNIARWPVATCAILALGGCPGTPAGGSEDADGDMPAPDSSGTPDGTGLDVRDGFRDGSDAEPPPVVPPSCGDGVLDPDEECDDGNRLDGDDCDWRCRHGAGAAPPSDPDPGAGSVESAGPPEEIEGVWTGLVGGGLVCFDLPLVWADTEYASVWGDSDGLGHTTGRFWSFERDGRRTGVEWMYEYPGREFGIWDLAWSGEFYGLVWCPIDNGPLSFAILDRTGKPVVGPLDLVAEVGQCGTTITWDGEAFVVIWAKDPAEGLVFARVDLLGDTVTGPVALHVPPEGGLMIWAVDASPAGVVVVLVQTPGLAGCGERAEEGGCVRWMALRRDGSVLHDLRNLGTAASDAIDVAWGAGAFGVVFEAISRDRWGGLYVATMTPDGELLRSPQPVFGARAAGSLRIAWGLDGWTVAHLVGPRGGPGTIIRTDHAGILVNQIAMDTTLLNNYPLGLAFDGAGFGLLGMSETAPVFARYVVVP